VGHVGEARGNLQGPLLAAAADDDLRAAEVDRPRHIQRLLDPIVGALE
jgi:hypothetical protein